MLFFKFFTESVALAFQQLYSSKLRSFLSLLGITIGIWSIISVLSAVDSLELNIRSSINKLGDDVVYVDKFSWSEDPGQNYWKWVRNPAPDFKDYEAIVKKVKSASMSAYAAIVGMRPVEYKSNDVSGVFLFSMTYDYAKMFNLVIEKGRYYTRGEYQVGVDQVLLGANVANQLFGENIDPIGKKVKISGRKFKVMGVLEKEGNSLLRIMNFDDAVLMSVPTARKFANVNRAPRSFINVKAEEGVALTQLEDELTAAMRAHRRLRPKEDNNFALNKLSIISNAFDQLFGVISIVGWIIGGFAILVGGFGVANIMFVSVKERTNIIGIKKALGAKRYVILMEFLIESIILCLIGGAIGLAMVYGIIALINSMDGFQFVLTTQNIVLGAGLSIIIGVFAGALPAIQAANMNPVDAIRA